MWVQIPQSTSQAQASINHKSLPFLIYSTCFNEIFFIFNKIFPLYLPRSRFKCKMMNETTTVGQFILFSLRLEFMLRIIEGYDDDGNKNCMIVSNTIHCSDERTHSRLPLWDFFPSSSSAYDFSEFTWYRKILYPFYVT